MNSSGVADVKPTAIEEKPPRAILDAVLLGLSIFLWALFGIYTREAGTLASLWPANAFLLAMLVRFPSLATRYAFPAALLGYFAADLLTGGTLLSTTILTLANLAGVALGYFLLSRIQEDDRHLRRPQSVLLLMLILAASSAAAGCVGAFANKILFERGMIGGFFWWFVTEFVNYVAIVPVILTIPHGFRLRGERRRLRIPSPSLTRLAPVLAFLLSAAASVAVGGPGALAFPVPALLWCAVTYGLFGTSVLTFLFSVWTLLGIANGVLHVAPDADRDTISLRLAVMLVALAPLMVASIFEARNRLIEQLRYRAAHDDMTGVLNRVAFFEQARQMLASANREAQPSRGPDARPRSLQVHQRYPRTRDRRPDSDFVCRLPAQLSSQEGYLRAYRRRGIRRAAAGLRPGGSRTCRGKNYRHFLARAVRSRNGIDQCNGQYRVRGTRCGSNARGASFDSRPRALSSEERGTQSRRVCREPAAVSRISLA